MDVIAQLRQRAPRIVTPVLGISLIVYFSYHLVQGDRGLLAYMALQQQMRAATAARDQAQAEYVPLAHRVALLRGKIDRDLLDERARAVLDVAAPGEIVIYDPAPR